MIVLDPIRSDTFVWFNISASETGWRRLNSSEMCFADTTKFKLWPSRTVAVVKPITFPYSLSNGPPLEPGEIEAVVWMI